MAGLFVSVTNATEEIAPFIKLSELDTPVIFFDCVPDLMDGCNKVCLADKEAAAIAAEAIIQKKKKMYWPFLVTRI